MEFTYRPMERFPRPRTKDADRKFTHFKAEFSKTRRLLAHELDMLGADSAIIQLAARPGDFLRDGSGLKAHAAIEHPGVVLSFETVKTGPVQMPCDQFSRWIDNLRAIALALEALRKVDRYGVTRAAEQYRGWAQLPPPSQGKPAPMRPEEAASVLAAEAKPPGNTQEQVRADVAAALRDPAMARFLYRQAVKRLHPDANGGTAPPAWDRLMQAAQALEQHHAAAGAAGG